MSARRFNGASDTTIERPRPRDWRSALQGPSTTKRLPEAAVIGSVSRPSGLELDFDFVELSPEPVLESQSCCGTSCGSCFICNATCSCGCVVERNGKSESDAEDIEFCPA